MEQRPDHGALADHGQAFHQKLPSFGRRSAERRVAACKPSVRRGQNSACSVGSPASCSSPASIFSFSVRIRHHRFVLDRQSLNAGCRPPRTFVTVLAAFAFGYAAAFLITVPGNEKRHAGGRMALNLREAA